MGDISFHLDFPLTVDDHEPMYDGLLMKDTNATRHRPKSPLGYHRVKKSTRPPRETVFQFADNVMERNFTHSQRSNSKPVEHIIEEYSPRIQTHLNEQPSHQASSIVPLSSTSNEQCLDPPGEVINKLTVEVSTNGSRNKAERTPSTSEHNKKVSCNSSTSTSLSVQSKTGMISGRTL